MVMVMAYVYTQAGEYDKACDELDTVLSVPSFSSINWLRIEPLFESLRNQPCFQVLVEKYGEKYET